MTRPARAIQGNRLEIPADLPPTHWAELVWQEEAAPQECGYFHPAMEMLSPLELKRLRAKLNVWAVYTGSYPRDISTWWEIRLARRRGDISYPSGKAELLPVGDSTDSSNACVWRCGSCGARWSDPAPYHCNLCGLALEHENGD